MKTKIQFQNKFFIPGNVPSSKNSRMWTGKMLIASEATRKWRKETKNAWETNRDLFLASLSGLAKPYRIQFTFVRKSKHRFDYVNPLQTVLDEMVAYKWIIDDNADEVIPYFGKYIYDKDVPGVWIEVLKN